MNKCGFSRLLVVCFVSGIVPAQATESLVNGGFETGNFTGWNVQTEAAVTEPLLFPAPVPPRTVGLATVGPRRPVAFMPLPANWARALTL
jgi:hypothetical protein